MPSSLGGAPLFVMSSTLVRSRYVSEAVVEPPTLIAGSQTEGFADLYARTFPRVYAYVASLLHDRASGALRGRPPAAAPAPPGPRESGARGPWDLPRGRRAACAFAAHPARRCGQSRTATPPSCRGRCASCAACGRRARTPGRSRPRRPRDGGERDLIALKFAGELSNAEIGRILGMSESAVGTRLHRTITKLREACHE
jgi:hypothetical protein